MQDFWNKLIELLSQRFVNLHLLYYWVVAILLFFLLYLLYAHLTPDEAHIKRRAIAFSASVAYFVLMYCYTVLSRETGAGYSVELKPFWSYYDIFVHHSLGQLFWVLVNLAMFVPLGFLMPLYKKNLRWWKVLLIAVCLSYFIELSQLLLDKGNFELVDDPLDNIVGCMIGYVLISAIMSIHRKKHPNLQGRSVVRKAK